MHSHADFTGESQRFYAAVKMGFGLYYQVLVNTIQGTLRNVHTLKVNIGHLGGLKNLLLTGLTIVITEVQGVFGYFFNFP